jgi:ABC-type sugar transport system substrate-binding protein
MDGKKVLRFSATFLIVISLALLAPMNAFAQAKKIGIVAQNMASATVKRFTDSFTLRAKALGWQVTVVDVQGDYEKGNAAFENFIAMKVDGIFNNMMDPNLVGNALKKAKERGIPVVNGDAGFSLDVVTNVTSHNEQLATRITAYLLDKMVKDGKTELLAITWPQHHGIRKRTTVLHALLQEYPTIKLVEEHVTVIPGQIEESRNWVTNYLNAHPSFNGAVWCAWDEPAAGAAQAISALGKKNIYVTGIDGNKWTLDDYIRKGGPFIATEAQNFEMMGFMVANIFNDIFTKKKAANAFPLNIYVPTVLVTKDNLPAAGTFPWQDAGPWKPEYEKVSVWPPY